MSTEAQIPDEVAPTEASYDRAIEDWAARMTVIARERRALLKQFLNSQPGSVQCQHHPDQVRLVSVELSEQKSAESDTLTAAYAPCPFCDQERTLARDDDRLRAQGVPSILLRATFESWIPRDESEVTHLAHVREFARVRKGFLVMVGAIGTGKSHLAVACQRGFQGGMFIKQSALLRKLRASYRDPRAGDPVEQAQRAKLLVIDEMGVSGGGKDEFPMLHDVLDHRHSEQLPTILTGNLDWNELREIIGDRLSDRLRQSAFKVLTFAGASHRAAQRNAYFD